MSTPQFPVANATLPFWRTQLHELDDHRSTEQPPAEADIVVIGAGYAGASVTYHLLEQSKAKAERLSIVILEAREACSGATGRNGGHLKPDPYVRASTAADKHGVEAAEEVASFEARQVREVKDLIERENIDCDFVITRASDVCLYTSGAQKLKYGLDNLTKLGISTVGDVHYSHGKTAEGISGVKDAKACFTYSAAHVWPYKLVLHLLGKAVSEGVNLQTNTPVQQVASVRDAQGRLAVQTSRGIVRAKKVIYASNAYTSALLPEFKQKIVPVRGICCRIATQQKRAPLLSNSYILRFNDWEYDYLIPRSDGSIVVGGARRDFVRDLGTWFDVVDDSKLIEPAKNYFDQYMQRTFHGWEDSEAEVSKIWTGSTRNSHKPHLCYGISLTNSQVMGYSSDGMPFVGNVPEKPEQYICAGFSGHGMPQIFLSAKAVASMVIGEKTVEDVDLPKLYRASRERLDAPGHVSLEAWKAIPQKTGPKL